MRLALLGGALLGAVGLSVLSPRDAQACGGCFSPPQVVTTVTDHRMILSISQQQTTLYDQIRYQGDPSAFAWVLPIHGTVGVGLSADVLFASLDGVTATVVQAPPRSCAPPPACNRSSLAPSAGAADDAGGGGVVVNKHEVVGPYDTVQLSSKDPAALDNWLAGNGFNIPDDIKPTIAAYVNEGFDFLAMKLVPGQGIASMRPVRVTSTGASPVLPLRMVAAGTGATVGITLWIVAEGKYEPSNFPFFYVNTDELVWDWGSSSSNYTQVRAAKEAQSSNTAWEVESSLQIPRSEVESYVLGGGYRYGQAPADQDYLPVTGMSPETADQVRTADLATLFAGITAGNERITRIRTDLARAALSKDLQVTASADQSPMSNVRQLTKSVGTPQCPTYSPCDDGDPVDSSGVGLRGGGCAASPPTNTASDLGLTFAGAFVAVALMRTRRRR